MSITVAIRKSKENSYLPVIDLADGFTIYVMDNMSAVLSKGDLSLTIYADGQYASLPKILSYVTNQCGYQLLNLIGKNILSSDYLVGHGYVAVENLKYVPVGDAYRASVEDFIVKEKEILNATLYTPRPQKVRSRYRIGTFFDIDDGIYVLFKTQFEIGITYLLCLKGKNKSGVEEFNTTYINTLTPIELDINVVSV